MTGQSDLVTASGQVAPTRIRQDRVRTAVRRRSNLQRLGDRIPEASRAGFQNTPTGQGADVVISAFHLVVGITAPPVVPVPQSAQNRVSFVLEALVQAVGSDLLLHAGPHLVAVAGGRLG